MWTTRMYETWIRISEDVIVNARNVVAVERCGGGEQSWDEDEGIYVHIGGAKLKGTITLEDWNEALDPTP